MRFRDCLLAVVAALGVTALYPMQDTVSAQSGTGVVISEFRFRGPLGSNDEFIELFNAGNTPVNVGGWMIRSSNNVQPPSVFTRATIRSGTVINPGCYFLIAHSSATTGFSGGVTVDLGYSTGFADDGGVALTTSSASVIVDQVGQGTVAAAFGEGQRLPMVTTNINRSYERRPGGALGHVDTNNNFADFGEITPSKPQNSSTCLASTYLPHQIQGEGSVSPISVGTSVTVRGVVAARTASGFFMQTETGAEDANDATSEGLFVAAAGPMLATAVAGRVVHATGLVSETGSVTHLAGTTAVVDVGGADVPAPIELTAAEFSDTGSVDQLERFEGMRVSVTSLTAVSGSEAGAFYAVLTGQARTFREPGVAAGTPVPACALGPCNIPLFDANPERLRVDSDGLEGIAAAPLSTGAIVAGVTGPLDFANGIYTLLPESTLAPSGGTATTAAGYAQANEFTVAAFVLGRSYPAQTAKASLLIRTSLGMPDVIAVDDADATALSMLAAAVDADAAAAGQPPPQYAVESGFLLKQAGSRVAALSIEQIGDAAPPIVLRAVVSAAAQLPQTITVIASQFAPFDPSPAALAARQAQANELASYIQFRQSNDPSEAIVAIGNYNAHRFNDGHADIVGTLLGTPAPPDQVATEAIDLVSPDLVSAGDSPDAASRYSSIDAGNAQLLEHVALTQSLASQFAGIAYPRVNADFADTLRDDPTVANRVSDRDPVIAYFTFPPDVAAPVFAAVAGQVAEAAGADGAVVHFEVPAASDNLDASVSVNCVPASGSTFPLGNTGVTCSAQDVAGNQASTSFTVTVQDTTAPVLLLPANINDVSPEGGKAVSFAATAIDAVTPSLEVTCTPTSGSAFAVGTATVSCTATDAAGNSASGSFTVTLTSIVFGRMAGFGLVKNSPRQTWFVFDVRESPAFGERGWVVLHIREGYSRERYFLFTVTDVRFAAGAGTVTFAGLGYWNGRGGYRYEITASDRGEPGRLRDTLSLKIIAPDGRVVENAGGTLHDGNIESFR